MRFWKRLPVEGAPVVGLAVVAYTPDARSEAALRCFLASLQAQSYPRWRAAVIHDGPPAGGHFPAAANAFDRDERILMTCTPARRNRFGHLNRQAGWDMLAAADYLGTQNADNYLTPVYVEALLHALQTKKAGIAYCSAVHSHRLWEPLPARLKRGSVDGGSWLARADLVRSVPWESEEFAADWFYLESLLKTGAKATRVRGCLWTHN